jgi:hypothetical protein
MKKNLSGLIVFILVMTTSTFATNIEGSISKKALTTFSSMYGDIKEVKWERSEDFIKASFTKDDHAHFAFFTPSGELMGTCINLSPVELPVFLQSELKRYRGDSWVSELFEFTKDDETSYFVTIENADQKVVLKSSDYANWTRYSKTIK